MTDQTNQLTYYCLAILEPSGAIKGGPKGYGERAATPALARLIPGNIASPKPGESLAVVQFERLPGTWTDSAGNAQPRYAPPIVVEIIEAS